MWRPWFCYIGKYLKMLDFTGFTDFYSFVPNGEFGRKRVHITEMNVSAGIELGLGNTMN